MSHTSAEAYQKIRTHVAETPMEYSETLSARTKADVFLKCEHLQHTGSFKFRGAMHKILSLSPAERERGVMAASTGNHGLGVARAAQIAGVAATIYMPDKAVSVKIAKIKKLGADIVLCPGDCLAAETRAREEARLSGSVFISPYNDETVIAGQGTIGVEMMAQNPEIDAVFISVGGGGLIAGTAGYMKGIRPDIEVVGCWPENAPVMAECLKAGCIIDVPEQPTVSDATAGNLEPESVTFPLCQRLIDRQVRVSEAEIAAAMELIAEYHGWAIEGAAGVAVAGFLKMATAYEGKIVGIVLCGGNIG